MADYSELKRKAQEIRDEVKAGANTANRVGLALEETVKALEAENKRAEQAEVSLENAVQMLQDETEDLPSIREQLETLVVNDLTTGGVDKALSAEMGKVLGEELTELEQEVGKADLAQLPIVDKAVAQALVMLVTRVEALESMVQALTGGYYHEELVAKELKIDGCSTIITGEGAPGAIPDFLGQIYVDTTNKESYTACGWDAVSDWKANN